MLTSENVIFNGNLFANSETAIRILGIEMSLEVVSDPDFESRLVLHAKQGKLKRTFFTICLKKKVTFYKQLQT